MYAWFCSGSTRSTMIVSVQLQAASPRKPAESGSSGSMPSRVSVPTRRKLAG